MKTVKQNINRSQITKNITKEECLNNGQSITKAIMMGGKGCCGGAYVEKSSQVVLSFSSNKKRGRSFERPLFLYLV